MSTIKAFIKRHAVLTYFTLTFAISWGGFVLVVGPGGFPGTKEQLETLFPSVVIAMLAGPSVAGILLTGLVDGRAGFRELLSRLLRWRVDAGWYAVALLPALLLPAVILFALSLPSPIFTTDDKAAVLLSGITAGLTTVLEEIGWTGFAVPRLRGCVTVPLRLGSSWASWGSVAPPAGPLDKRHFLRSALSGPLPAPEFLLWHSATDGLPDTHDVGLRPYGEPARGDTHARESYSQHDLHLQASGDRGVLPDLYLGIGRRAVGRRCGGRLGQPRAALATTAPEAGGLKSVAHHLLHTDVGSPSGVGGVAHGVTPSSSDTPGLAENGGNMRVIEVHGAGVRPAQSAN